MSDRRGMGICSACRSTITRCIPLEGHASEAYRNERLPGVCYVHANGSWDCAQVRADTQELELLREVVRASDATVLAIKALQDDSNSWPKEEAIYETLPAFDAARGKVKL